MGNYNNKDDNKHISTTFQFPLPIPPTPVGLSIVESAKRLAAYRAVDLHFPINPLPHSIGVGSGSTVIYVVERISQFPKSVTDRILFIPTGYQSRQLILSAGLPLGSLDDCSIHGPMEVAFDGADEIDRDLNCIKGGGACLFQEKLVAVNAKKFVAVADYRKISDSLGTMYARGVPIEVVPPAAGYVLNKLVELGSIAPELRMGGTVKAGPVVTDNGNFIIDAPFPLGVRTGIGNEAGNGNENGNGTARSGGEVSDKDEETATGKGRVTGIGSTENVEWLAQRLKNLVGVVEHGLFWREDKKPVAAYFGMQDGSVCVLGEGDASSENGKV